MHLLLAFNTFSPDWFFFLIVFFAFGAIIGSFLNVVIHRLPLEESIIFPNSHCPNCSAAIHFYDNIPILSWLILRGRCRSCQAPISYRYPLVEFLTGLAFAAFFWHDGFSFLLPVNLIFSAAIIALIFIDAEHMYLPDVINYPGLVLAFLVRLLFPLAFNAALFDDLQFAPLRQLELPLWVVSLLGALLGALAGGGFLWLVGWLWKQLRGVEAMGLGDVKMMLMVGAYLGWRLTILSIFLAAFVGAVAGIAQISAQKERDLQTKIPFGIFLGLGTLLSLLFGAQLIDWYLRNFVPN